MPRRTVHSISVSDVVDIIATTATTQVMASSITVNNSQVSVQISTSNCHNTNRQGMSSQTYANTSIFQVQSAYSQAISDMAQQISTKFLQKNTGIDLSLFGTTQDQLAVMLETTLSQSITQNQLDAMNFNSSGEQIAVQICTGRGGGNTSAQSMHVVNRNIYRMYMSNRAVNNAASSAVLNLNNFFDTENTGLLPAIGDDIGGVFDGFFSAVGSILGKGIIGIAVIVVVFMIVAGVSITILIYYGLKTNPGVVTAGIHEAANVSKTAAKLAPAAVML